MNKNITTILAAAGLACTFALSCTDAHADCCGAPTVLAQAASIKTVNLNIEGMECGSCAASVKSALQKLDGVKEIDITFEKKGGTVEFDPAKVDEKKIVETVNKAGFEATLAGGKS